MSSDAAGIDFINDPNLDIRDLSYTGSRTRQLVDLAKGSFFDMGFGPQPDDAAPNQLSDEDWPRDRLEIYIKEKSRGPGYVCDIVFHSDDLPVIVYAVLINRGRGLEVAELELFRRDWGCFDGHDNYLHPDEQGPVDAHYPPSIITSDVLRRIPLGEIISRVERDLPDDSWRNEGIRQLPGADRLFPDDLNCDQRRALEQTATLTARRRGRPELSDQLLIDVAWTYLDEARMGPGLTRRLAERFDRPEPTIRDWIAASRRRGFLGQTSPGRRGATPGPNLPSRTPLYDESSTPKPDLTRTRRRTVLRMVGGEGVLDADLTEDALMLFIVSGLVCNDVGVAKMDALRTAMADPAVLEVAVGILDKARRRRAIRF